jgi:hypothetical protein
LNFCYCFIAVLFSANARQRTTGTLICADLHQPPWTLRNKHCGEKEDQRGYCHGGEHPAPAILPIPRLANQFRRGAFGDWVRNQPVDDLRGQNSHNNGQLIQGHQPSAPGRRANLCNISWGDIRGDADGQSASNPPGNK